MGRGRIERSASFNESIARPQTEISGEASESVVDLARAAEFTDPEGTIWRRRGVGYLEDKRLRKLLRDPAVRVLHDYLGDVADVPPADRAAFWAGAEDSMAKYPTSRFVASEFKNDAFEHLVVIHESC